MDPSPETAMPPAIVNVMLMALANVETVVASEVAMRAAEERIATVARRVKDGQRVAKARMPGRSSGDTGIVRRPLGKH